MTTYYISGPMRSKPEHNFPQFHAVAKALAEWLLAGAENEWTILNPADDFDGDATRPVTDYMQVDLEQVLQADVLVLLPGWRGSEGANREVNVAIWTGKSFMEAKPLTDPAGRASWTFVGVDVSEGHATSVRAEALDEAKALITGDRNNAYGPPHQDFRRTAHAATAYGYRHTNLPADAPECPACGARPIQSHDTAIWVMLVKLSRLMWTPTKRDSWVDTAGYAGCGYECALEDEKERAA